MILRVSASYVICPYFFDGTVSGVTCIKCGIVIPEPSNNGIMYQVSFQQDSAPAHFTLTVCEFLSESLIGQYIGWGWATSPLPLPWWPCHPNLSTPDNSLCTNSVVSHNYWYLQLLNTMNSMEEVTKDVMMHKTLWGPWGVPTGICEIHTVRLGWNK